MENIIISACFEAKVAPCVFAITANNLLVVCDKSSCSKTSGILHLRNCFGETKLQNR
jgi:hypothetical protein